MKQREIASRQEKQQFIELTTAGFNWDAIKFKNQYFKKEDYLTFSNSKAIFNTPEIQAERVLVQTKLLQLHESIKEHVHKLKLKEDYDSSRITSSLDPHHHVDIKLTSMWITYGRGEAELNSYYSQARPVDFMNLQIIIKQKEVGISLMLGNQRTGKEDREYFKVQMQTAEYRTVFFKLLTSLGAVYWIEIAGEKMKADAFQSEDALWEFTKTDDWMYYTFVIGKTYLPGDVEISTENIVPTISKEFDKLVLLYRHIKDSSFEKKK